MQFNVELSELAEQHITKCRIMKMQSYNCLFRDSINMMLSFVCDRQTI